MGDWTLFSNHGHVLVCLARDNEARLRKVADDVGITERAVQKIVRELQQAGFVTIKKHGRCNRYDINSRKSLRHDLEARCQVGRLLQLFSAEEKRGGKIPGEKKIPADAAVTGQSPVAVVEGKSKPNPKPEADQQARPLGECKSPSKKRAASEDEIPGAKDALDTRQQGSLF